MSPLILLQARTLTTTTCPHCFHLLLQKPVHCETLLFTPAPDTLHLCEKPFAPSITLAIVNHTPLSPNDTLTSHNSILHVESAAAPGGTLVFYSWAAIKLFIRQCFSLWAPLQVMTVWKLRRTRLRNILGGSPEKEWEKKTKIQKKRLGLNLWRMCCHQNVKQLSIVVRLSSSTFT